jgi:AAA domain
MLRQSNLGRFHWDDRYSQAGAQRWIVKRWLPEGGKTILAGHPGTGKSFLALHLAMCIARGKKFFGSGTGRGGLVVYCAGEGGFGLKNRLVAYENVHKVAKGEEVKLVVLPRPINLFNDEPTLVKDHEGNLLSSFQVFMRELEELWGEFISPMGDPEQLRLIVFDTLATSMVGADENSSRDVGMALDKITTLQAEIDTQYHMRPNFLIVHHLNKAGDGEIRGSSVIKANADTVLKVTRIPGSQGATFDRIVSMTKQKDGIELDPCSFRLQPDVVGYDEDHDAVTSCAVIEEGTKREQDRPPL